MSAARILLSVALSLAFGLRAAVAQTPSPTTAPATQPKAFTNAVGMKFVPIPAGKFLMGSPANEKDRMDDEIQHEVTLSKPFWMQTTEVTQKQWVAVIGKNPSKVKGDDLPVESVSWNDVQNYIKKLSEKEKGKGIVYRLPTEAEWEYACRAGTQTRFHSGDADKDLDDVAWHSGNSDNKTHPVATKKPNAFGLHDMHGNTWEWCSDWYGAYDKSPVKDPQGPANGNSRKIRGGSWNAGPKQCRAAYPNWIDPVLRSNGTGFRLVAVSAGAN